MSALIPERPRTIFFLHCRAVSAYVLAIMVLILLAGCRGLGTQSSKPGVASLSSTSTLPMTMRNALSSDPSMSGSSTRRITASVIKQTTKTKPSANRDLSDEDQDTEVEPAPKEQQPGLTGLAPNEATGRAAKRPGQGAIATVSHNPEEDETESFIDILGFAKTSDSDETDPPLLIEQIRRQENVPITEKSKGLRLTFPPEIPGANAPDISLPVTDENRPESKLAAINTLFPPPPPSKLINPPKDRVMTLEELEDLALRSNPILAQSLAAITVNQGTTIQQGIYPNPVVGYESDTVGSSFTRDYQGIFVSQLVKTAGKLTLQRAAANMDLMNSQLAYERTKLEILRMVRAGYYNVLVAQESNRINDALVRFTNQVYTIMIDRLKGGEQSAYELSQLQSLVIQARWTLNASQNRYLSAWKQLATATGVPNLPLARLEGRVEMNVPNLNFDVLLDRVLTVHPDMQASRNLEAQSRIQVQLQKNIPIPDVTVAGAFQNDSTTPGYGRTSYNLNVSVPVPIYDRNQGNILREQGRLKMNMQQLAVTTNQLTTQLADAFERFQSARVQAEYARTQVLPDLARAYRGYYEAHINTPETVEFSNIIIAQQNLSAGVAVYIASLLNQWLALTDIANLIQARDFNEVFTIRPGDSDASSVDIPSPAPREGGRP